MLKKPQITEYNNYYYFIPFIVRVVALTESNTQVFSGFISDWFTLSRLTRWEADRWHSCQRGDKIKESKSVGLKLMLVDYIFELYQTASRTTRISVNLLLSYASSLWQ